MKKRLLTVFRMKTDLFWSTGLNRENSSRIGTVFTGQNFLGFLLGDLRNFIRNNRSDFFSSEILDQIEDFVSRPRPRSHRVACRFCGLFGHLSQKSWHRHTYSDGIPCSACGLKGHKARLCRLFPNFVASNVFESKSRVFYGKNVI